MSETPFIIGLTGSIGMGKTTTAGMFRAQGVPVWDADAAVHRLYASGGAAVQPIGAVHPAAIRDGAVDRMALKSWIAVDKTALAQIEAIVHPLVAADRTTFIAETDAKIVLFDIPLLFETGAARSVDFVIVVSAPPEMQRQRISERTNMDKATLETILAAQMPDADKRARADAVIETLDLETTKQAVQKVLGEIQKERLHA